MIICNVLVCVLIINPPKKKSVKFFLLTTFPHDYESRSMQNPSNSLCRDLTKAQMASQPTPPLQHTYPPERI